MGVMGIEEKVLLETVAKAGSILDDLQIVERDMVLAGYTVLNPNCLGFRLYSKGSNRILYDSSFDRIEARYDMNEKVRQLH